MRTPMTAGIAALGMAATLAVGLSGCSSPTSAQAPVCTVKQVAVYQVNGKLTSAIGHESKWFAAAIAGRTDVLCVAYSTTPFTSDTPNQGLDLALLKSDMRTAVKQIDPIFTKQDKGNVAAQKNGTGYQWDSQRGAIRLQIYKAAGADPLIAGPSN